MKAIVSTALAAMSLMLVLAWASAALAENWVRGGSFTHGPTGASSQMYIDMDSVQREGGFVRFTGKQIFSTEFTQRDGIRYIRTVSTTFINCLKRTYAIVSTEGYDRRGKKTVDWVDEVYEWMEFPLLNAFTPSVRGSFMDVARTRLCR